MDRIKYTVSGLYVSKSGKSTDSGNILDFVFHPEQQSMQVIASDFRSFTDSSHATIAIPNPAGNVPYVNMKASDGTGAHYETYCAILEYPFTTLRIANRDGKARTVWFTVFL
ncbi:hypothetical protein [Pseudochrobactrum sp. MP213Fo]|uniref:hypothetical protein n=1 Tax=Pseudochrobactrum sp. MP213Fo TaxID=3022250 RepID=UPI003BA13201